MSQHLLAIEIFGRKARYALIASTLRRATLVRLETIVLPEHVLADTATQAAPPAEDGADTVAEAQPKTLLEYVREAIPEHIDSVILGADPFAVSSRLLQFPFTDLRKVEAAIEFELETQVPYELADVASSWLITQAPDGPERVDVLTTLMPRHALLGSIADLASVHLEPRAVVVPAVALSEFITDRTSSESVAVIALHENASYMSVLRGSLRYARALRLGSDDVDRGCAKRLGLSVDQVRQMRAVGTLAWTPVAERTDPSMQQHSVAIEESMAPWLVHVRTTLRALPQEDVPTKILLTGSLSTLPGITAYLHSQLGIAVDLLDLPQSMGLMSNEVEAVEPDYASVIAMGLALWRHGQNAPLNFRRGALAYQGDIQLYRSTLTRLVAGTAIVAVLAMVGSVMRYSAITQEEKKINRGFCDATLKIVGREICDPTAALASMRQTPGAAGGVSIPAYSAATLLDVMSNVLGPEMDVTFEDMDLRVSEQDGDPDKITAKGEAASFDATEQVVAAIKKDPCVQEASVSRQRKKQDSDRVEFNLAVSMVCPAGVIPGSALANAEGDSGIPAVVIPASALPSAGGSVEGNGVDGGIRSFPTTPTEAN